MYTTGYTLILYLSKEDAKMKKLGYAIALLAVVLIVTALPVFARHSFTHRQTSLAKNQHNQQLPHEPTNTNAEISTQMATEEPQSVTITIPATPKLEETDILQILQSAKGVQGLYLHELNTDPNSGIYFNSKKPLFVASTSNLAIATVTIKVLEEKGIDIYSVAPNSEQSTYAEIIEDMITNHSEISIAYLTNYVRNTGHNFNTELGKLGISNFDVYSKVATPNSYGELLEAIATNKLNLSNGDFLLSLLDRDSKSFEWSAENILAGKFHNLVGAVFEETQTLQGIGSVKYVTSDCGIWTAPSGQQFAFVYTANYRNEREYSLSINVLREISSSLNTTFSQ
jgi:hypothetical protein